MVTAAEAREHLTRLQAQVTTRAQALIAVLPGSLACRRGCADCCVDELTVFTLEADLIRFHHSDLLTNGAPHPKGACAFLGPDGACRIYDQRPYVCRTQGLPLRWQATNEQGETVELRDICPLNEEPLGVPVQGLDSDKCWALGEFEGALASLQAEAQGSFELRREPLRGLFSAGTE